MDRLVASLGLIALSVVFATPSFAAGGDVASLELSNGLRVVVIEDHRADTVVHMVWYPVGSADEPRGQSGVAHYLEHLMFQGTDDLEKGEFSSRVAAEGGTDNAFTSYDYTAYFQRVAADRLGLVMSLEAERMQDLVIDAEAAATERLVILEERSQRVDNAPFGPFLEELRAALWRHHPYGTPIIGWRHEMEQLGSAEAQAWYEAHYAPDRAIVVVAGAVTPTEAQALAETHYGALPRSNAVPETRPEEPPQQAARRVVMEDARVGQPMLVRLYRATERNPGDQREAAALTLLAELLGVSSSTSVLAEALQFDQQIAAWTSAGYDGLSRDQTAFSLSVVPVPGVSLAMAEEALDATLAHFLANGIDPEQLDRIRRQLRADEIFALDNTRARADRYGRALASGLTLADVEAWPDLLQQVSADDIIDAASRLLRKDNSVIGLLRAPAPTPALDTPPTPEARP